VKKIEKNEKMWNLLDEWGINDVAKENENEIDGKILINNQYKPDLNF